MRRFMAIALLVAAAMLVVAPVVSADVAKGKVTAIDAGAGTLSIDSEGKAIALEAAGDAKAELQGVAAGDEVEVTYNVQNGKNMVSDVKK